MAVHAEQSTGRACAGLTANSVAQMPKAAWHYKKDCWRAEKEKRITMACVKLAKHPEWLQLGEGIAERSNRHGEPVISSRLDLPLVRISIICCQQGVRWHLLVLSYARRSLVAWKRAASFTVSLLVSVSKRSRGKVSHKKICREACNWLHTSCMRYSIHPGLLTRPVK